MKYQDAFEADTFYHVFNHAVGSDNLFRNDENFRYFLRKYAEYTTDVWDTYAYCLMPNHFHLLVRVKSINHLETHPKFKQNTHELVMQQLSNLLNAYAKAYNIRYERKGALFLDFTKRAAVQDDVYFRHWSIIFTRTPYIMVFARKCKIGIIRLTLLFCPTNPPNSCAKTC